MLGLVKRVFWDIRDTLTRQLLYCTLVRPRLEYACNVWSPYTAKQKALIENVQRRATKFILNYPPSDISYIERLKTLKLLPLEFRREISDLILLYKFRSGTITANFASFLTPATSRYSTRSFDSANYRPITQHKQNYFLESYYLRTVRLWNSLSSHIKHATSLSVFH